MSDSNSVQLSAFYGVKAGMTRIFDKDGNHVSVTVIKLVPNKITQVKTLEKDGYSAYQVGFYEKREKLVKKPFLGHLAKAGIENKFVRFAELKSNDVSVDNLGKELDVTAFTEGTVIDVTATSKGKGFQGVMKRYNFSGGPATHGSHFHRRPGSIGNRMTPAKVFKGKKMPGQMGNKTKTVQNLKIAELAIDKGYVLIKGSVPGGKNGFIRISKAIKAE